MIQGRPQGDTPNSIYYNLDNFCLHWRNPLSFKRTKSHIFISTTENELWRPKVTRKHLKRNVGFEYL